MIHNFWLKDFTTSNNSSNVKSNIDWINTSSVIMSNSFVLMELVQKFRDDLGFPIYINSFVRSPTTNVNVGGTENSGHINGCAVDMSFGNTKNFDIAKKYFTSKTFPTRVYKTERYSGFGFRHAPRLVIPFKLIKIYHKKHFIHFEIYPPYYEKTEKNN